MLTLTDVRPQRTCAGFSRRDFLRIGALGACGGGLPLLLSGGAQGSPLAGAATGRSVVVLFLQGGPSHLEFFDPKMTAPDNIRSTTGEVKTSLSGITFGGTWSQLAARADKIAVVRSYGSQNSGHSYMEVMSGGNPLKAAMSAVYSRIVGVSNPHTGIPSNILVLPEAVRDGLKLGGNFETSALPTLTTAGSLGPSYAAFDSSGGGQLKKDMELRISPERLLDRQSLLARLDDLRRTADRQPDAALGGGYTRQAFDVIAGGIASAFDLRKESHATLERYDTSRIFRAEDTQRWYDMRRSSNLLGHQMLLARRLVEAGAGFVTVSDCGWDMHANGNSPRQMSLMGPMTSQVDHAVAAFIDDVTERGLADKILLVVTGEMGRTPQLNKDGGRDHYGNLTPLLLFGGGLKMGQVVGQSDSQAAKPTSDPYTPKHLWSTVFHQLFDLGKLRLAPGLPREIIRLTEDAHPIRELLPAT